MAFPSRHFPAHHPQRLRILLGILAVALAIVSVWTFTPLADYLDQQRLLGFLRQLRRENELAVFAIPLLFGFGCLLFFPINILIIATAHLFPMRLAFFYVALGVLVDLCTSYSIGRMVGPPLFRHFFGRRNQKIIKALGSGNLGALVLLRIVPIAPNNLINLTAGASRIPFPRFAFATFLGMAPGTVLLIMFQKNIIDVIRHPTWWSVGFLLGLAILSVMTFRWIKQRFSYLLEKNAAPALES